MEHFKQAGSSSNAAASSSGRANTGAPHFYTVDMSADDLAAATPTSTPVAAASQQRPMRTSNAATHPIPQQQQQVSPPSVEQEAVAERILLMLAEKDGYITEQTKTLQLLRLEDQRIRRELHDCTEAKTTLFEQYQWLVKDVNERDEQLCALQEKHDTMLNEANALRSLMSEKDAAIQLQNAALSEQAHMCETYRAKLEASDRANDKLQRDLQAAHGQAHSLREELRQGSTELERLVSSSHDSTKSSQLMLQTQSSRIAELQSEISSLSQVRAENVKLTETVEKLQQAVSNANRENASLQERLEDMEDRAHEHKYNHDVTKKEFEMMSLVLQQREDAIADLQREAQRMDREVQAGCQTAVDLRNANTQIFLLEEKNAQLTLAVTNAVVEGEQLRQERDASLSSLAELRVKLDLLEEELAHSHKRLESQHLLFERHSVERQAVASEASSLHGTLDEFEDQLDQAHRRTEQLVAELRHRSAEVEELERRLHEEGASHRRELLEQQELYTSIASAQADRIKELSFNLQEMQETASQLSVSVQRHEDGHRHAVETKQEMEGFVSELQHRASKAAQLEQSVDKLELSYKLVQRESQQHKLHAEQLKAQLDGLHQKHQRAVQRTRIHEDACKRLAAEKVSLEHEQPSVDDLLSRNAQLEAKIKALEQRCSANQDTVRTAFDERKSHLHIIDSLQQEVASLTSTHQTELRRISDRHRSESFKLNQQLQLVLNEKEALDVGHHRIADGLRKIVTQLVEGLGYLRHRGEVTSQAIGSQIEALEELLETIHIKSKRRESELRSTVKEQASRLQWSEEELLAARAKVKLLKSQLRAKARQALHEIDATTNAVLLGNADMNLTVSSASNAAASGARYPTTWIPQQPKADHYHDFTTHLHHHPHENAENAKPSSPANVERSSTIQTSAPAAETMAGIMMGASSALPPSADVLEQCDQLSQFLGVSGGYRELLSLSRSVAAPSSVALDTSEVADDEHSEAEQVGPRQDRFDGADVPKQPADDRAHGGSTCLSELSEAVEEDLEQIFQRHRRYTPKKKSVAGTGDAGSVVAEAAKRRSIVERLVRIRTELIRRWLLQKFLTLFGLAPASSPGSPPSFRFSAAEEARVQALLFSDIHSDEFIALNASVVGIDRIVAQARDDQQRDDELLSWFMAVGSPSASSDHHPYGRVSVASLASRSDLGGFQTVSEVMCAFADHFVRSPGEAAVSAQ